MNADAKEFFLFIAAVVIVAAIWLFMILAIIDTEVLR